MALLMPADYLQYLRLHKTPSPSPYTLRNYQTAIEAIGVEKVDTNQLPELYKRLLDLLPGKGYVNVKLFLAVTSAWLHKNGFNLTKEINYYTLHDEIKKLQGSREAYSDQDIDELFSAAKRNSELTKLLVLMHYSGLRIGACYPIYYSDFLKVEGYDVWTYEVTSKGFRYNAMISNNALAKLNQLRLHPTQKLVVQYDAGYSASFDKLYRTQLSTAIRRNNLYHLREGKSIFHSLHKSYARKLLMSGLDPTDYTFKTLMGHIPKNSTATKFYITPDGKKIPPELIKRCAEAYSKTPLMTMEYGLGS